jgi:hypothetical protein
VTFRRRIREACLQAPGAVFGLFLSLVSLFLVFIAGGICLAVAYAVRAGFNAL